MITRFDHAVIAVPDIPAAIAAYRRLGFDVAEGGRHPSLGTRNAIIRFGLDYIELLAVENKAEATARGPFGAELAGFLEHASGLVGFVLASDDLDAAAAGLKNIGQTFEGPFAMDRERPDGRLLAWRLVLPGSSPWRKPWPFLIEWETPDDDRLSWDSPGNHANDAVGVAGIDLLVADMPGACSLYETAFGLTPVASSQDTVSYQLGSFCLNITTPANDSEAHELAEWGPGPYRLNLRLKDANTAPRNIPRDSALGARICLKSAD